MGDDRRCSLTRSHPHRRGRSPTWRRRGGRQGSEPAIKGDAAEHLRGVLHIRYRTIICAQLSLIIYCEGPMIPLHKSASGCNQVHLCFAPSAVFKGSAHQVAVAIWYTFGLNIWGQVADQSASQRSIRYDGLDAIPDARRGVLWRGVRLRGRTRACAHRAGMGTWRVTLPDIRRRFRRRASLGIQMRVDLKDHRDGTRPAHQDSCRVC